MPETARILVVEDNAVARELVSAILSRAGYRVTAAADGREALYRLLAGPRPDLILLDMMMPGLDGWHFLEQLRRLGPTRIPVIVTTGSGLSPEWVQAHDCQGLLPKPIEPEALLHEVGRWLSEKPLGVTAGDPEQTPG